MSQSSDVVVIDIGSKCISAYCAERLSDDNFAVKNSCEIEYSGYADGDWLKPEEILPSIGKLIEKIERGSGKIKTIHIGVPAQFCTVRTVYDKIVFPKPRRVTPTDIREFIEANDPFPESPFTRIHVDSVYYMNDRGERTHSPIGTLTSFLKAQLSYIGASTDFISFLRQGLIRRGIKTVRFMQSEYVAALNLFSEEERESGVILADIGYLATSVLYIGGDALLDLKTFSLGGGIIPMGLCTALNLPYDVASSLAAKINLGYKDEGDYTLRYDTDTYVYPVEEINSMAKDCIGCIVSYIRKAISGFRFETSPYATIYLTGGGFSEIRCARDYIAKCFARTVEIVQPSTPNFEKPYYSTAVGLIKRALLIEKGERFGFFKKLFGI